MIQKKTNTHLSTCLATHGLQLEEEERKKRSNTQNVSAADENNAARSRGPFLHDITPQPIHVLETMIDHIHEYDHGIIPKET